VSFHPANGASPHRRPSPAISQPREGLSSASKADTEPQVKRYLVELRAISPARANGVTVAGHRFAITRDPYGVAPALAGMLRAHGAEARIVARGEELGQVDGLVHLETLAADSPDAARSLFTRAKQATRANPKWIVAATGLGGRFGEGPSLGAGTIVGASGLLKSLAKEVTALRVRAVDLATDEDPKRLADHIFRELLADDAHVEVGYAKGERHTLLARPSPRQGSTPLALDARSVILVSGGGRGITALVARALARRFGCTLELVGRSELTRGDEDADLSGATDAAEVRRVLARRGAGRAGSDPRSIEQACRRILSGREVRETVAACRNAGARVDYHAVDVRDEPAFEALIDRLRERHGRIDGVIHGAGLIEDKLFADKAVESFERVYETKVLAAFTLARKLADQARFFAFFSSTSGAFGNRGQTDYAAANDAMDKLARQLHGAVEGQVLSINWGPWRGAGMVKKELEREYDRRGIGLIPAGAGVESFLQELEGGPDPQVVLTAAAPEVLS
jgi:NAD(P)-dependent dehydrogenase (short-subunit alcohol dehydrogenase family)